METLELTTYNVMFVGDYFCLSTTIEVDKNADEEAIEQEALLHLEEFTGWKISDKYNEFSIEEID